MKITSRKVDSDKGHKMAKTRATINLFTAIQENTHCVSRAEETQHKQQPTNNSLQPRCTKALSYAEKKEEEIKLVNWTWLPAMVGKILGTDRMLIAP